MKSAHKIVYNTIILYIKLIIVMIIGFLIVRLELHALGEVNYGIYALVAGVVGMLAIMQSAMSTASMRFMAHSLGGGNFTVIRKTFNTTLLLHFLMGFIVVVVVEIGGYFMFEFFLKIPQEKLFDAKMIFHFMALTTFISIIAVPYDAVINSHENLLVLSIVDILGSFLRLGVAIYLGYTHFNLLLFYGFSLFVIQVIMRIIKQWYSIKHYKECKIDFRNFFDGKMAKTILAFSGWNLFGSIAGVSVIQMRSVLLNMFFGVNINAAEGISKSATAKVNTFSTSLTRALNPQLVKSEGIGNRQRMLKLTFLSTKYSALLFMVFALPVIVEMPFIFHLWLDKVPKYTIVFSRLVFINLLIGKFTFEITNALRASGDIKAFQITETIIILMNIPIAYIFFKSLYPPYFVFVIFIIITLIVSIERLFFGYLKLGLSVKLFFKLVILPVLMTFIISSILVFILHSFMEEGLLRLVTISIMSTVLLLGIFRYIGMDDNEIERLLELKKILIKKIK